MLNVNFACAFVDKNQVIKVHIISICVVVYMNQLIDVECGTREYKTAGIGLCVMSYFFFLFLLRYCV